MFKDSEDKKEKVEFTIMSDARETTIHETTQKGINDILGSGHEVHYDILKYLVKKPSLQEILANQYIKRSVNGVAYTIGRNPNVDNVQKNLMG